MLGNLQISDQPADELPGGIRRIGGGRGDAATVQDAVAAFARKIMTGRGSEDAAGEIIAIKTGILPTRLAACNDGAALIFIAADLSISGMASQTGTGNHLGTSRTLDNTANPTHGNVVGHNLTGPLFLEG